jgi:lysophospholipase L1-like esterase
MGCSCTEFGNYDSFFEELINQQYPNNNFTYVNIGIGGWSSYQGLQQLKRDVLPMKPKMVTIYYGWNDHWCNFGYEDKTIGKFNMEHSGLLQKLSGLRVVQLTHAALLKLNEGDNQRKTERVSIADFRSNLTEMISITKNNGIRPVLLTAPSSHIAGKEPEYLADRWLTELSNLIPLHQNYVQTVREVSAKEQVQLIDLYKEFRKLNNNDLSRLFQEDGIHLTEEGDEKIAKIMYEEFRKCGMMNRLAGIPTSF